MTTIDLAALLRAKPAPPQEVVPEAKPNPRKPSALIEFEKVDGITAFVHVRSKGKTRTLKLNRDEEGNLLSATLYGA